MIDTYISADKFQFRQGVRTYAFMLFKDLKMMTKGLGPGGRKGLSADECWQLDELAKEYVAGQVFTHKACGTVVLGPARTFTHEVTLHAAGNPDFQQYADTGPKLTVRVCSIEEAIKATSAYQVRYEMGGGNCAKDHGIVWELSTKSRGKRKKIGEIYYNGCFLAFAEIAAFKQELQEKYGK